ncbi:MAG: DUF4390 domain-containing protein [Smithellaceae bacterium]
MRYIKYAFAALVVGFLLTAPWLTVYASAKSAVEPRLTDLLITNDSKNVLLYARLVNAFRTETESAILAGVPAVFTLVVDVYRERSVVWDKSMISREIRRTIKYDNLKKTFTITTNGNDNPVILPDFESAQKAMADFSGIAVAPIASLVKGNTYYAEVKVKIDKVRLPFYMEYVFFFVSYWDIETPLYKQRFSY